jgi:hypothetical protein
MKVLRRAWLSVLAGSAVNVCAAAPALIAPDSGMVGVLSAGRQVFSNRPFLFSEDAARHLGSQAYLFKSNQDALAVTVVEEGDLAVLTAVPESPALSTAAELEKQGFVRDAIAPFQPFGANPADRAGIWRKQVKKGEVIRLSPCWSVVCGFGLANQSCDELIAYEKKVRALSAAVKDRLHPDCHPGDIFVNKPDYIVFIPRQSPHVRSKNYTKPDLKARGDTYNDHFQVIADEKNGLYYAFWTQATWEGCADQHIAFSKSADKGLTWTEPVVLAGSECRAYPKLRASWQQPMLTKSGRLYCLWNQQTTSRGPHCGQMFGSYSDDQGETWTSPQQVRFPERMDQDPADVTIPPQWCNWQRPLRLGENGKFFVGCSRHGKAPYDAKSCCKIEFWQFENMDEDPDVKDIRFTVFAKNRDMLDPSKIVPTPGVTYFVPREDPAVEEAAIVKLPDGRLFAMMRSSVGSPVWSQSRDGGKTWSPTKALLDKDGGTPYKHPRSPCPLYDWKGPEAGSGYYIGFVHCTFDMTQKTAYQKRGPLYLIAGRFNPNAEQPIEFSEPKLFAPRPSGNSFYTSYTVMDGKGILWFNDMKYYLLGREIGPEWFK